MAEIERAQNDISNLYALIAEQKCDKHQLAVQMIGLYFHFEQKEKENLRRELQ